LNVSALTQTEIRDIIMGAEIIPPSQQKQQIAELEKQAKQTSQMTAVTTKTNDKHARSVVVTTTSPFEQQAIVTKTDWRIRAICAANLHIRTNNIFLQTREIKKDGYTYIIPHNILKKFICIADLRTQIAGLLYGVSLTDSFQVKEVKCIVMPPQWGNHQHINMPQTLPDHHLLKDLEPLGWIHTQSNHSTEMVASEIFDHAKMLNLFPIWNGETCICLVVAFMPGSCSLNGYKITTQGYEFTKDSLNLSSPEKINERINPNLYDNVQILMSDRFLGFFMVPETGSWNYNFMGVKFSHTMKYDVKVSIPKEFYHELHRPVHFLEFSNIETAPNIEADEEDLLE